VRAGARPELLSLFLAHFRRFSARTRCAPAFMRGVAEIRMGEVMRLLTVRAIAERLGVPVSRVRYVCRTRRSIRPAARADGVRVFREVAVGQVAEALAEIDAHPGAARGSE